MVQELPVAEVFEKQHAQALQDFGQFYKLVSQLPRADGIPQQKFNEETPPDQLVLEVRLFAPYSCIVILSCVAVDVMATDYEYLGKDAAHLWPDSS